MEGKTCTAFAISGDAAADTETAKSSIILAMLINRRKYLGQRPFKKTFGRPEQGRCIRGKGDE
jgi:hypothetical protein